MFLNKLNYALVVMTMVTLCAGIQGKSSSGAFHQATTGQSQSYPASNSHHIHLLLLNGTSGKPVTGVWVLLKGEGQNTKSNWPQSVRSNSEGVAEFSLAAPIPEKVGVSFGINEFSSCSDAQFVTEQILSSGVVAQNICATGRVYSAHPPVAGQLVVYGRGITVWQRIGQDIPFLQLFR